MTWNFDLLFDVYKIAPWPIHLPNGKVIFVERCGKIKLGSYMILENVLYTLKLAILYPYQNCWTPINFMYYSLN